jgi:lysyl endopeptidase
LGSLEMDAALQESRPSDKKSLRFALERAVGIDPSVNGGWLSLPGYRLWRVHIVSAGAESVGLLFNHYELAAGVKVFLYDPDMRHVRGAYTSGNNKPSGVLATTHIPGQEVIVEMQVPLDIGEYGSLRIGSISHGLIPVRKILAPDDHRFGRSQACEIDILCDEGAQWQQTKRSVVRIQTPTQYCTGVLLNNTAYDGIPYVLTAEHCINRDDLAQSSVFVFNYESPECFDGDGSVEMSISGSELLATADSVDFSLVRLSVPPPDSFDVYYAGWDRGQGQFSYTSTIHHPMGDVKKISFDFEVPSIPANINDLPDSDLRDYYYFAYWWIRQWDIGSTEGGSSGGPLFNAARRVIGSLSGGKAECGMAIGYDSIAERTLYSKVLNVNDYFTQLGVAWDYYDDPGKSLESWLDPTGSGAYDIDGYEPSSAVPPVFDPHSLFRVYPNPANDLLRVEPRMGMTGEISYRLADLSGRVILKGLARGDGTMILSLAHVGQGLYLLLLEEGGREDYHKIMIGR